MQVVCPISTLIIAFLNFIFRTRPHWSWGPLSLLYNGYRVSFPGVKWPDRGVSHPPTPSAEVKEREELCVYSPSGPSWPVLGRTLPLPLFCEQYKYDGPTYTFFSVHLLLGFWSDDLGFESWRRQNIFSSPKRPHRLWDPSSLMFNVQWG